MIEIYLYCSIAPIPFATMTNREWGNIGTNYIRSLLSLAFQGLFIMVIVGIYSALVKDILIVTNLHLNCIYIDNSQNKITRKEMLLMILDNELQSSPPSEIAAYELLKKIAADKGMKQSYLTEQLCISKSSVSKYLNEYLKMNENVTIAFIIALRLNKSQQNEVLRAANICLTADTKRNKVLNTLLTVSSWSDELITVAKPEVDKSIASEAILKGCSADISSKRDLWISYLIGLTQPNRR